MDKMKMFKDRKKKRYDDEEEGSKKRPGSYMGPRVMNESRNSGAMFGNHGSGPDYPNFPKTEFAKGKPKKDPGSYMGVKPMDESRASGGKSYGNHGLGNPSMNGKMMPDDRMGERKMGRAKPDERAKEMRMPRVKTMERDEDYEDDEDSDDKKKRKGMAVMILAQKMKKR
jgi:hypothetical protein